VVCLCGLGMLGNETLFQSDNTVVKMGKANLLDGFAFYALGFTCVCCVLSISQGS
jgi:hypothetical protein